MKSVSYSYRSPCASIAATTSGRNARKPDWLSVRRKRVTARVAAVDTKLAMRRNRRQTDLARPDHDVGEVERREQAGSERRVVLAIRVERDDRTAGKVLGCMCERGTQRSALATIGVEADDMIAGTLEHRARRVERAVIHAEHEHGAHVPTDGRDDGCNRCIRVECGKDTHRHAGHFRRIGPVDHSATSSSCSPAVSSTSTPSSALTIHMRSRSSASTLLDASASRVAALSAPFFLYSSTRARAPSMVYLSTYSSSFTSMISSTSRRWYTRLPERFFAGWRKRNWLSQ